jgi:hypothetical protein
MLTKIIRLVELAADHSSSGNPEGISKESGKILSYWSRIFGGAGLDFQGMRGLSLRCPCGPGGDFSAQPWFIVRMSPPSYPSAWLLPNRARFRFTW